MRRLYLILFMVLASLSAASFAAVPAIAWWSGNDNNHQALARLSKDQIDAVFKDIDPRERTKALNLAADKPDLGKKFYNIADHEAKRRISGTLCAAVNDKNRTEALKRLVIGFHYLADNGDITERWQQDIFRYIACRMLLGDDCKAARNTEGEKFMQEFRNSGEYSDDWKKSMEWGMISSYWDDKMKTVENSDGLIDNLRNMANTRHSMLKMAYEEKNFALLRLTFIEAFACIRACQNRLTTLFTKELAKVAAGGRCGEDDCDSVSDNAKGRSPFDPCRKVTVPPR